MYALLAALLLLLAPLSRLSDLRRGFPTYAALTIGATLLLYLGLWAIERRDVAVSPRQILVGALLLRLALLPMSPMLSDDVYRYLWDGRLVAAGIDPYPYVPADPTLARYHDTLYRLQGYPTTNTIYPPGAQLLFAAAVATGSLFGDPYPAGYLVWKGMLLLAEMVAIGALLGVLRGMRLPPRRAILYAWHPLAVVELAGQGHTDALWVLALALALWGYAAGRGGRGLPALALGGALRLHPLTAIPLWLRFMRRPERNVGLLLSLPFLALLALLLTPGRLGAYLEVLTRFTNFYEFNGGLYYAIKSGVDTLGLAPSNRIAGGIATLLQLLVMVAVWCRPVERREVGSLAGRLLLVVSAQLALGAKVHVWYMVAPLALLPLTGDARPRAAWCWVALIAPLTYLAGTLVPFREPAWVLWLEWGGGAAAWLAAGMVGGKTTAARTEGTGRLEDRR